MTLARIINFRLLPYKTSHFENCEYSFETSLLYFCLKLSLDKQESKRFTQGLLELAPDLAPSSALLVRHKDAVAQILVSFDLIQHYVLPRLTEVLRQNPDLVEICKTQYNASSARDPYAKFYAEYHKKPITSVRFDP